MTSIGSSGMTVGLFAFETPYPWAQLAQFCCFRPEVLCSRNCVREREKERESILLDFVVFLVLFSLHFFFFPLLATKMKSARFIFKLDTQP
jgi:hypothetical protein